MKSAYSWTCAGKVFLIFALWAGFVSFCLIWALFCLILSHGGSLGLIWDHFVSLWLIQAKWRQTMSKHNVIVRGNATDRAYIAMTSHTVRQDKAYIAYNDRTMTDRV